MNSITLYRITKKIVGEDMKKFILLSVFFLLFTTGMVFSQTDDYAYSVATDQNNNIIVCGTHKSDYYVTIKYSPEGEILWISDYISGYYSSGMGVAVDGNNNIYTTGVSETAIVTIKYSQDGDVMWIDEFTEGGWKCPYDIAIANNGDILVGGSKDYQYLIIRYSQAGDLIWSKTYPELSTGFDLVRGLDVDSNDNFVFCGGDNSDIVKCNSDGDTLWTRIYDMGWGEAQSVCIQSNDNILVCGANYLLYNPQYLVKYSPDGTLLYEANSGINGMGFDVALTDDENPIVVGGVGHPNWTSDALLVKYNTTGDTLWTIINTDYFSSDLYDVSVDGEDNIIVTGQVQDEQGEEDILLIKYGQTPSGAEIIWTNIYNSGAAPPVIQEITDITNDQGGWVRITWYPSPNDDVNSSNPVALYGIWRRIDNPSLTGQGLYFKDSKEIITLAGWDGVGTVPAIQDTLYNFVAHTLVDSNSTGINYSVFMITAHSQNPIDWIASEPDSGYSVDNIPPEAPYNVSGEYANNNVVLNWNCLLNYPDFSHFSIYRDRTSGFEPNIDNLIGYSYVVNYIDTEIDTGTYYYVVSTFDVNDNQSSYSNEAEVYTYGVDNVVTPNTFFISNNYPNPFTINTEILYRLPVTSNVIIKIYDIRGRQVKLLINMCKEPGVYTERWDGNDDSGNNLSSGIYFYKMKANDFESKLHKMILMK